jgi:hypothetical protein
MRKMWVSTAMVVLAEGHVEHDIGRLAANAGQLDELARGRAGTAPP